MSDHKLKTQIDNNPDNIIEDAKSLEIKNKVLARQKTSSIYNSISKAAMYLGGVLSTAAIGAGLKAVFDLGAHAAIPAVLGAFAGPVGVALAVGTAIIAVGIATDYLQSRIWQSCTFDNLEANADSTARHLVKEMKAQNMCLVQEQDAPSATEKKWAANFQPRGAQENWAAGLDTQRQQDAIANAAIIRT